jgi:hypothetical protein
VDFNHDNKCFTGLSATTPNADLTGPDSACEVDMGYSLCPDEALQGSTTATVETNVNVPWMDFLAGSAELPLHGSSSRATTPWEDWSYRAVPAKQCQWRKQNTRGGGVWAGPDHSNKAAWGFEHHTLREVVEACSSSHPAACVGISWRGGAGITFAADGTQVQSPRHFETRSFTYSSGGRGHSQGFIGEKVGWLPLGEDAGQWIQLDLGSDMKVDGVVTQGCGSTGSSEDVVLPTFKIEYSTSARDLSKFARFPDFPLSFYLGALPDYSSFPAWKNSDLLSPPWGWHRNKSS